MREIRMSGSVGRGLRPPYPIASWWDTSWRELRDVKLSPHKPSGGRGPVHSADSARVPDTMSECTMPYICKRQQPG